MGGVHVKHRLLATPDTVQWGFFDAQVEPVLRINSGDSVELDTISGGPRYFKKAVQEEYYALVPNLREIHEKLEGEDGAVTSRLAPNFASVVIQILLLDIVFSLDSVITAVGMARQLGVMVAAVIIALVFMLIFSGRISGFIQKHPTLKMLALSFLLLIGCALVAEGFHKEIPKGYIYFAMAFSVGVESLNIRLRAKQPAPKVALHQPYR